MKMLPSAGCAIVTLGAGVWVTAVTVKLRVLEVVPLRSVAVTLKTYEPAEVICRLPLVLAVNVPKPLIAPRVTGTPLRFAESVFTPPKALTAEKANGTLSAGPPGV